MNTFLWIHDYQWNAISSIATTIGVLLALFIPIIKRHKERRNLIYLQGRKIQRLLLEINRINDYYHSTKETEEVMLYCAKRYVSIEIPEIDSEVNELAKYDVKLHELITRIFDIVRNTQDWANGYIESKTEEEKGNHCVWLRGQMNISYQIFQSNMKYLKKKRILQGI